MLSLRELQAIVRRAVVSGDDAAIASLLVGGGDSRRRLAIHHRHYQASLVNALLEKFPATVRLTGSAFLAEAARRFVAAHPPDRPCIAEYGEKFPAFLAAFPNAAHLPYLRDFAELEHRFGQVAIEVDRPPLPITEIAALDHKTLADAFVKVQAGLRYWHASWPVDELLKAYLTDSAPDLFEVHLDSVCIEVRGARGDVRLDRLSLADFTFRTALLGGRSLGEAVDRSIQSDPGFDPSQAFVTLLTDGLITGIDVCPIQTFVYPNAFQDHLVWGAILLLLLTRGPGVFSVDYLIERMVRPSAAGREQ